jgi:hypothetical protein
MFGASARFSSHGPRLRIRAAIFASVGGAFKGI